MDENSQVAGYAAADLETNWLEGPPDSEGGGDGRLKAMWGFGGIVTKSKVRLPVLLLPPC